MRTKLLAIAKETFQYFSEDPSRRATDGGRCMYQTYDKSRQCAVGRYLEQPDRTEMRVNSTEKITGQYAVELNHIIEHFPDDVIFKPGFENVPINFWKAIQYLHDFEKAWNTQGATKQGHDIYQRLVDRINKGEFD